MNPKTFEKGFKIYSITIQIEINLFIVSIYQKLILLKFKEMGKEEHRDLYRFSLYVSGMSSLHRIIRLYTGFHYDENVYKCMITKIRLIHNLLC